MILIGLETEFFLVSSTTHPHVWNPHGHGASPALPPASNISLCLEELTLCVMDQAAGIELQTLYSKPTPGQYEIVAEPMLPIQAVDTLVWTRECILGVARIIEHTLVHSLVTLLCSL